MQTRRTIISILVGALLSGCGQSGMGKQLDINYATTTGTGSMTAAAVRLPHGRYTFFSFDDQPGCVKSVVLLDRNGTAVADDASFRSAAHNPPPGAGSAASQQMIPTLVQRELASGNYRLKVTAGSGRARRVEQILNSTLSSETPLPAIRPPSAPSLDLTLGNSSTDLHFRIDVPGIYHVRWSITPCDRYSLDLVRSGSMIHLGDGVAQAAPPGSFFGPQTSDSPMFLGAGDWSAKVSTHCFWQIELSPWRGSTGGGGQGFAP